MAVLIFGVVLLSAGSLAQAVRVFRASDPTARYWGRIMLFSTIVMNISIVLHIAAAEQGFNAVGAALLSMLILISPWPMLYASFMMNRAEKKEA